MSNILVTGASSGIGRELVKKLINQGDEVWGVARRGQLLLELKKSLPYPQKFHFSTLDISKPIAWPHLISQMRSARFIPQVVIFNAAILEDDIQTDKSIDVVITRKIMETNYFSILFGLNRLMTFLKKNTQIIFIGSSTVFKGSGQIGIGYSSSKAALNSAFESLHQRFGKIHNFKIIHFGPIRTDMVPFNSKILFMKTPQQAAAVIVKATNSPKHIFYFPRLLFFLLHLIRLLPSFMYLFVIGRIEASHKKNRK